MPEFTMDMVRNWWLSTDGRALHYKQTLGGRFTSNSDDKLRVYIGRLLNTEKLIEKDGSREGVYRLIQELPAPVDWQGVDSKQDFPILLPFGLRELVWIDNKTEIMVMGSKDSGKSGFLYSIVAMNMNDPRFHTVLLSNFEGGINQIKRRFDSMDINIPKPAPFDMYHVTENFHDYIKEPDTLYVIDYVDVPDSGEFFMIAPVLSKIQNKLRENSVAAIGLQKKKGVDLAFGGAQTVKKASLSVAIDKTSPGTGKLKIITAKVPTNPLVDPVNMAWTFNYENEGTKFTNLKQCNSVDEW